VTHAIQAQLLAKNEYDKLGQLIKKRAWGSTDITGQTSLQKVDYSCNIRRWLKSINDVQKLTLNSDPTDLFAFKINYNNVDFPLQGVDPLYNRNIAETLRKTDSDNVNRGYGSLWFSIASKYLLIF